MHEKIEEDKKRLEKLAMIDNVTQLGTRHNLYETCRRTIAEQPANDDTQFGILFIDIDNFKRVNDSMGHRYGDELLKTAGDRISNSVRQGDLVCRIGGDEFCVLAFGLKETKQIEQIADNILNALRIPLFINSKQLLVSASIGVVTYPKHGSNVEELLQHADIALHKAKFLGKNKIHLFSSEMDIKAKNDIALESDLSNAIKNQEFTLYYQPKIDLVSGKLVGAEALTRWNHPQKGLIPPYQFIPFLEESGLILVVGHWVIKEALRQSNEWRKILGRDIGIAINLSYRQFLDPYLFEKIETAIEDTQIPPHLVEIELTESMMMEDFETHNKTIEQLKSLGIQIAMDDFGTGYSSLAYLKKLSMDILKIDRSFVQDLPKDKNSMEIVSAIIAMSHKLRLKVVAEGIEEVEQHAFLKDNLCELGQGYLFSKPLPNDQFIQLAKDWEKNKKPLP